MHKIFFSFALFTFHYLAPPLFAFLSLSFSHSLLMWRGHDLRLLRSQIAGMLATAERTGTNIPNIPKGIRDPCCPQTHPPKWPRVQSANLSRCSKSTRLIGQTALGSMTPASQPIKGWSEGVRARVYFHQTDQSVVLQPFLHFILA